MRCSQQLRLFAAPLLLILVACIQIYRAHAYHQSPWKGGGFGMFASTDAPSARFLRCYLATPAGDVAVTVPPELKSPARHARTVPTDTNLAAVAQVLADATWIPEGSSSRRLRIRRPGDRDTGSEVVPSAARVEVWRRRFQCALARMAAERLAVVTRRKSRS
jgi:hypothetical protein